jgi:hypothetical protein
MDLLNELSNENIYKTIYDLQGERHPCLSLNALNEAADYIAVKMNSYGFNVRERKFKIEGCDIEFRNIEGSIGNVEDYPSAVLMAHYDTVANTQGANDDNVGVATMIEIGRVLLEKDNPPPIYFVATTLEESSNPNFYQPEYESLIKRNIKDKNLNFTSLVMKEEYELIYSYGAEKYGDGISYDISYGEAIDKYQKSIGKEIIDHFNEMRIIYKGIHPGTALGVKSRIGSTTWVEEAIRDDKKIAFNITLDEMGYYKEEKYSQGEFAGVDLYSFMNRKYKLNEKDRVGNFVLIQSNIDSENLGNKMSEKFELNDIDMPYGQIYLALTFDEIVKVYPFALGSEHASFWKYRIPSIFLFDSSVARNPHGHSPGDTIDKLNFDKILRVAKGITALLADENILKSVQTENS